MHLCIHIHTCVHTLIHTLTHIFTCIHTCTYMHTHAHMHTYTNAQTYTCTYGHTCTHTHMHAHVHTHTYAHMCTHTHRHTSLKGASASMVESMAVTCQNFKLEVFHHVFPVRGGSDAEGIKAQAFHRGHQAVYPAKDIVDSLGVPCHSLELWAKYVVKFFQDLVVGRQDGRELSTLGFTLNICIANR